MTTLELLTRARGIVARAWTKGYYAYNSGGRTCMAMAEDAVRWCAAGALDRAGGTYPTGLDAVEYLVKAMPAGFTDIPDYNDQPTTTQADVVAWFDRAIHAARLADWSALPHIPGATMPEPESASPLAPEPEPTPELVEV